MAWNPEKFFPSCFGLEAGDLSDSFCEAHLSTDFVGLLQPLSLVSAELGAERMENLCHLLCGPIGKLLLKLVIPHLQLVFCGGFSDLQEVEKSQGSV